MPYCVPLYYLQFFEVDRFRDLTVEIPRDEHRLGRIISLDGDASGAFIYGVDQGRCFHANLGHGSDRVNTFGLVHSISEACVSRMVGCNNPL